MWMTNDIATSFKTQYAINNKFADYKSNNIEIELFSSNLFDQIALINYKDNTRNRIKQEVITKRFCFIESEMLAYIPYCVSNITQKALICGTLNAEIAYYLSLNNIEVDMVVNDMEALNTLSGFLPNFKKIYKNSKINLYENFISLKNRDYDIIIHLGNSTTKEFEALQKIANKNFIIIFALSNLYLEPNIALDSLSSASKFGNILMPFIITSLTPNFYAFLSNCYHPLADLQLQKSDMLENIQFYNSNIHTSVFRLPTIHNRLISSYVKN